MVVVNTALILWIREFFSTTSGVYVGYKPVGRFCMRSTEKLDNFEPVRKSKGFAQSVPVDIHMLIHKAWIKQYSL